jgi:hypothetical protein
MRKICFGIFGILACAISSLCADGFSEYDNLLLAAKDFPFPPDESDLPEGAPSDDSNGSSAPQGQTRGKKSEKEINPEVQSRPKAGKDIFPPESE